MAATDFSTLSLKPALLSRLEPLGFHTMTPVQAQALPPILQGEDVVAQAHTGSGKTAAFALGFLNALRLEHFAVQTLVLCPTRELADQVAEATRGFARQLDNVKTLTLCGGVAMGPQINSLRHSAHVVVGTPGRVLKHLQRGFLNVASVSVLVLDEADRMLDMGFSDEIDAILAYLPQPCQSLLFSATLPADVKTVSARLQNKPVHIDALEANTQPKLSEGWLTVTQQDRSSTLTQALKQWGGRLNVVFCNTKIDCAEVTRDLQRAGLSAVALHGDLEQVDRVKTLVCFANGTARVLVATDVAARGLDIEAVDAVFNYELPHQPEVYVHRSGRAGRAGAEGRCISLVTDREMPRLHQIEQFTHCDAMPLLSLAAVVAIPQDQVPTVATLEINGGRRTKLRPGDILGALTGAIGLPGDAVGKIDILESVAFVAVDLAWLSHAVGGLNKNKIKGRPYRARRVHGAV